MNAEAAESWGRQKKPCRRVVVVVAVVLHEGEALSYVGRSIFHLAAADTCAGAVHLRQMDCG